MRIYSKYYIYNTTQHTHSDTLNARDRWIGRNEQKTKFGEFSKQRKQNLNKEEEKSKQKKKTKQNTILRIKMKKEEEEDEGRSSEQKIYYVKYYIRL